MGPYQTEIRPLREHVRMMRAIEHGNESVEPSGNLLPNKSNLIDLVDAWFAKQDAYRIAERMQSNMQNWEFKIRKKARNAANRKVKDAERKSAQRTLKATSPGKIARTRTDLSNMTEAEKLEHIRSVERNKKRRQREAKRFTNSMEANPNFGLF